MTCEIQKCHPERGKAESHGSIKDQFRRRRLPNWLARTYWCRSFKPQYTKHAILFMQNEPNFKNTKMNITHYTTNIYKQNPLTAQQKNEPKRTQFRSHRAGTHLFMQNKANFQNAKICLKIVMYPRVLLIMFFYCRNLSFLLLFPFDICSKIAAQSWLHSPQHR